MTKPLLLPFLTLLLLAAPVISLSTSFHGQTASLCHNLPQTRSSNLLTMRKQKSSDKRTRRSQRGVDEATTATTAFTTTTITTSPMETAKWKHKKTILASANNNRIPTKTGGRNRARKRSTFYNSLSSYHNHFLELLTAEYKAEVSHVMDGHFFKDSGVLNIC
jgi:hypothetical protein